MFLTGFADEASHDLKQQISATRKLGWKFIETRFIGEKFFGFLTDEEFEEVVELMSGSGIRFNCYGSGVANWSKAPRPDEDFAATKKELLTALPRMQKLGIKLLRGMSFKLTGDEPFDSPELEKIIFRKVNELVKICADAGVLYGHENCMNYGGQSHVHTLRLLDNIQSDNFKLIFDTGNPIFTFRRIGQPPYPLQSTREFYENVREFIYYVHIKDAVSRIKEDGTVQTTFQFAGEGSGDIPWILTDLFKRGYDGGFSIEPHVATVFHEKDNPEDSEVKARRKYETYIEYGRRFEALVKKCRREAGLPEEWEK
ncbi:MAG: Xylose isomerase-like TIM barrel [Lentisphaerae bacterium ADurb.Bin242]|nr:MAG: Xylose isomerase-like TIM barrel [Lentisphaerae bacterium ADurb.Bin242]